MTATRRDFLKASGLMAAWVALSACQPGSPENANSLEPGSTPERDFSVPLTDEALIVHTLRRMTWGPTPEMLDKARLVGLQAFLDEQLSPQSLPDGDTQRLLARFSTLEMTPAERYALEQPAQPVQELIAATILRQWSSTRQLYEMLVDFWSNHFNIFIGKNFCRVLKTDDDQQVIRTHALGTFRDMLHASAHSPAMLVYLDQASSNRRAPNENYARELLELHTVGVDGGYTHKDVADLARVLTGWSVVGPRSRRGEMGRFAFNPRAHDEGTKQVMGLVVEPQGEAEGNAVLDMLADHKATARFISEKLARRFIADDPPASAIENLAQTFENSGGNIPDILRALFASPEFKASAGMKVKRPLEFFVSALRLTGATVNFQNRRARRVQEHLRLLGQVPFTWPPPDGFPDVAAHWSTTSGFLERWNFGLLLTSGQVPGLEVDLPALTHEAASPEDVVDLLSLRLLGEQLPQDARAILVDYASQGDLGANLAPVAGLILGSPHFQIR